MVQNRRRRSAQEGAEDHVESAVVEPHKIFNEVPNPRIYILPQPGAATKKIKPDRLHKARNAGSVEEVSIQIILAEIQNFEATRTNDIDDQKD